MNGAINLKNNHKVIDELNVFPVPDGDTGTNMSMTVMSGVREMTSCESSSIIEVAKVLSRGALMGARGNSGVILSQFFRGLYVGVQEVATIPRHDDIVAARSITEHRTSDIQSDAARHLLSHHAANRSNGNGK